jgi:RimJ/RimL family protein N-acetyltransferase
MRHDTSGWRIEYRDRVSPRFDIDIDIDIDDRDRLRAREPTRKQIVEAAPRLARFYSDPHNQAMLAQDEDQSAVDVVAHYRALAKEAARAFFLEVDDRLVGDADLRSLTRQSAEVAILIGDRSMQGRGLGTRFGIMLHAFAFGALRLRRTYASIIPANEGSLRLFEKLGYERDDTPAARRFADEPTDLTLSLGPTRFQGLHGPAAARVRVTKHRR